MKLLPLALIISLSLALPAFAQTGTGLSTGSGSGTGLNSGSGSGSGLNNSGSGTGTGLNSAGSGCSGSALCNPLSAGTNLETLLSDILAFVVKIGTVVVILMLVYVGFMFSTARGEPAKISQARAALLWTVVGALILLGAQAIASGIQATANALSTGS